MTDLAQDPGAPRPLAQVFAARLRELRARFQVTQDDVAQRIGCHESAVSRWENGNRFPTPEDLVALSDMFRVSVDFLLGKPVQYLPQGAALVDQDLLDRLDACENPTEFEALLLEHEEQAVWLPVPPGAVVVSVQDAMRRARKVADKFKQSRNADRLFRPRG